MLFLIIIITAVFDQLSKYIISVLLKTNQEIVIIKSFFKIVNLKNSGAAFGILEGRRILFIIAAVLFLFFSIYLYKNIFTDNMMTKIGLGLTAGGTIGNLIDRIFYGYVADFIDLSFWPVFNFADLFITAGIIILVREILLINY
ncbi:MULTISPECIES: signal peptidase II [unclassified Halanaerobium]|uniref:signal peptidase II n=1 Tax=unclassified Halanaerobium TaxID=2641197 RepID=UPI000E1A57EB|nr:MULTISPECIES: signal peptidase II [unclassified Halanaerobium]RCW51394.1 signal peptidase II [Halanaerobium sp. MA284_MarDTE_T2]RCW79067.1 signal peptidase II [Halanaerobium sp. DL-01]